MTNMRDRLSAAWRTAAKYRETLAALNHPTVQKILSGTVLSAKQQEALNQARADARRAIGDAQITDPRTARMLRAALNPEDKLNEVYEAVQYIAEHGADAYAAMREQQRKNRRDAVERIVTELITQTVA